MVQGQPASSTAKQIEFKGPAQRFDGDITLQATGFTTQAQSQNASLAYYFQSIFKIKEYLDS